MRTNQWRRGFLIGFLLLVIFWLATLIWGLTGKTNVAISQASDAKRRYEALESRKVSLEANLAQLQTVRGQDAAIRTSFGVVRPGEEVIVVVPPQTPPVIPELSWWQKVLHWF